MADPYPTDEVQPYRDLWYTFHDGFLEFNAWLAKRTFEKQKDLVLLEVFKESDISVAWWCTSTHTFILAFGEVIVTLEDVANLMLLLIVGEEDPRHITLTPEEHATLVALKKVMKRNANASSRSWRGEYSIDFLTWIRYFRIGEGKDSPYVRAAFLTTWLSKFVFKGFPNQKIMVECIPLAIRLAEGVKLPLALLMLGMLYHMLDLLHFDEILSASYYIIESNVCLSLLQMFAWERFCPYHFGRVTSGKALKEYPMVKCGYTNRIALSAYSCIGKRKIKGQIISKVDGLLDHCDNFNFHASKTMPQTFASPEVSLFDKALPTVFGSQIVEFTMGNSSHLEMLAMITPSMLPCTTWQKMWSLECYCLKRVARQFGYDKDVALTPSSDKTDWNRAMRPYIDEVAVALHR
ncbi:hypothetical protein SLEP1_g26198 [Rubroshorea leprosula]|uniref:Aminotransferase-like plant mobile domain-containing protein n=1 Tax=Rubroshorea leprosula TaxID=152421 RepID=A0AAV5JXH5_9ROSI|nr:hypothetical protein SLEP1_g26198 [Rubroshorea leprosula]